MTNAAEFMREAMGLITTGNSREAEQRLRDAISARPDWLEPRIELSKALFMRGESEMALDEASLSTAHIPDASLTWRFLASLLFQLGKISDSAHAFRKALLLAPATNETLSALGTIQHRQREDGMANPYFLRATLVDPFDGQSKLEHAKIVLLTRDHPPVGTRLTRQAQLLSPGSGEAAYLSSLLHQFGGSLEIATAQMRWACLLAPKNASAHYHLGNMAFQTGNQPLARPALLAALELGYSEAKTRFLLGRVLRAMGWFEESEQEIQRAVALDQYYAEQRRILNWTVTAENFHA